MIVGIIFACVSWPAVLLSSEYIAVYEAEKHRFHGVKVMFFVEGQRFSVAVLACIPCWSLAVRMSTLRSPHNSHSPGQICSTTLHLGLD